MRIIQVDYISEYKLKLTFGNNETKIVDLSEKVKNAKGIFLPLKDMDFFKQVAVDDCQLSIYWPNGADICPDVLYEMGTTVSKEKLLRRKIKTTKRTMRKSYRSKLAK